MSVIWAYMRFESGLPKMHGEYTQVHWNSDAWTGKENPPTKTTKSEKQAFGLDQWRVNSYQIALYV